jgi:hypothetical protein
MPDDTWRRWLRGDCPCCGWLPADREWEGTPPRAVGEGVSICGRCVANRHLEAGGEGGLAEAMLRAIVLRDDGPVDDVAEAAYARRREGKGYKDA